MKRIVLVELRLSRFRSFVTPTAIDLRGGMPGMVMLAGDNQVEPRLGANGAGKSTVWDGLVFALYGSSVKGLRAADLVSRGAEPPLEVILRLRVDGTEHTIRRTAPPNRINVDGQPAEQADIDALVGLTRNRFLHAVVFGQSVPLFLDLSAPERGEVLDGVLQLEIWLKAAELASKRHREQSGALDMLQREIARTEGIAIGIGDPKQFAVRMLEWEHARKQRIERLLSEFEEAVAEADALMPPVLPDEAAARQAYENYRERHAAASERAVRLSTQVQQLRDTVRFLARNDFCPVCAQPITAEHVSAHTRRSETELAALDRELETAEIDRDTLDGERRAAEATWRALTRENDQRRADHAAREKALSERQIALERDLERVAAEVNPHADEAARVVRELERLQQQLDGLREREQAMQTELAQLDFWRQGFRRVRLFCLDQVLTELTAETRNALLALGLAGWDVKFTTASETKSGTLRLGVQAEVNSPVAAGRFESCSGGEGQRARLAVSLGLAQLIQRWAGVSVDFEVWDEPTAWLSDEGIADLLDCLAERAEAGGKTLWLCDHRALAHGGFRDIVTVVKDREGSRIAG